MLNSFSIATSIHRASLLWTPLVRSSIALRQLKSAFLNLDSFRSIEKLRFPINRILIISVSFVPDLFRQKGFSPSPKHPKLNLFIFLTSFLVSRSLFFIWYDTFFLFIMRFMIFDLTFGVFEIV